MCCGVGVTAGVVVWGHPEGLRGISQGVLSTSQRLEGRQASELGPSTPWGRTAPGTQALVLGDKTFGLWRARRKPRGGGGKPMPCMPSLQTWTLETEGSRVPAPPLLPGPADCHPDLSQLCAEPQSPRFLGTSLWPRHAGPEMTRPWEFSRAAALSPCKAPRPALPPHGALRTLPGLHPK